MKVGAILVEIIRQIWDRGYYRDNPWLIKCHEYWFDEWVAWRASLEKAPLDEAIQEYHKEAEKIEEDFVTPIYSEKPVDPELQTGEAALLGGEMRLTAPWYKPEE